MQNNNTISYFAYFFGPTADKVCKKLNIPVGFKMTGENGQDVWRISANKWKKIQKIDSPTIVKLESENGQNTESDTETL